eukprot:GGOE01053079.1.p2 GENE.GGOE01053079.1~~GGOE01053079.1.p2  ORF type:complete len:194 (-),score=21.48 GGOE01053079.1:84-665(-)
MAQHFLNGRHIRRLVWGAQVARRLIAHPAAYSILRRPKGPAKHRSTRRCQLCRLRIPFLCVLCLHTLGVLFMCVLCMASFLAALLRLLPLPPPLSILSIHSDSESAHLAGGKCPLVKLTRSISPPTQHTTSPFLHIPHSPTDRGQLVALFVWLLRLRPGLLAIVASPTTLLSHTMLQCPKCCLRAVGFPPDPS